MTVTTATKVITLSKTEARKIQVEADMRKNCGEKDEKKND
jgi:hypothetical protein